MTPDEIRRLYAGETPATAAEAEATAQELRTDPAHARRMYLTLLSLAPTDAAFRGLATAITQAAAMELIRREMVADDSFALFVGALMADVLHPERTPRGKVKSA
ncbi:MAG: hypothetical protein IPK75_17980 [Acidobacteria bacterium]|nr:hypothetical protein [Acidobacteriota bacterium]